MKESNIKSVNQSISSLTESDERTFNKLLSSSHWGPFPLSYEGSFAFFNHRAGYFPLKYFDGKQLATFYFRNGRYSILRPIGSWNPITLINLANYLFKHSKKPVYYLKLTYKQFNDLSSLSSFHPIEETSALENIGDDRYDQLVIPVKRLLHSIEDKAEIQAGSFPKTSYLRHVIRAFEKRYKNSFMLQSLSETQIPQVEYIIDRWREDFRSRYQRGNFDSDGDDRNVLILPDNDDFLVRPYKCLLYRFSKKIDMQNYFGFVAYIDNEPSGFAFLSRTSKNCAALYANLALTERKNLSYYLLYKVVTEMAISKMDYINVGGQETNTLRRFYLKFNPFSLESKEERCYDVRYMPDSNNKQLLETTSIRIPHSFPY